MKERQILFSGAMVRAIMEGRKSQTRRVCKGARELSCAADWPLDTCPYGQPGDRLVVRETWQYADWTEDGMPWIRYRADGATRLIEDTPEDWSERLTDAWASLSEPANYAIDNRAADRRWRPAIHMPWWASRIKLDFSVRVERLQDISEADAIAEGIRELPLQQREPGAWWCADPLGNSTLHCRTPRAAYARLWESINGPGSWDANPWVWVVEFKRIDAQQAAA